MRLGKWVPFSPKMVFRIAARLVLERLAHISSGLVCFFKVSVDTFAMELYLVLEIRERHHAVKVDLLCQYTKNERVVNKRMVSAPYVRRHTNTPNAS